MRVCGEDYVWRENVKWKNPTPSARRSARYFTNMDEGLDVTLIGKDSRHFSYTQAGTHASTPARSKVPTESGIL